MNRCNPYKLFDYYTEADAQVFFGREQEISSVIGDILANKLLVLFARSGSGKTSLLNAGIGPALNDIGRIEESDPGITMVTVRLSADISPEQAALNALKETLVTALPDSIATLYEALQHLCGSTAENHTDGNHLRGVVLVFDQFEELFISLFKDRPDIRKQFAENLAQLIHDTSLRAYIVLSLRSDHFHHLNEFRSVIPSIFQNNTNLELRPFDDEAALRVIEGPANLPDSGFSWATGLPERIITDLKQLNDNKDGILPIHLQIVCHGLLESLRPAESVITNRHYEYFLTQCETAKKAITPAQAMIASRIIAPLEDLSGQQRRDAVRLLRELVTQHRTKSVRGFEELAAVLPEERLVPLLDYLEQKLLLRVESGSNVSWYELRHDYLALVICPWLDRQERQFERKAIFHRFIIAACLITLASLSTKLWYDWHSYYAEIGAKGHEDELVIKRRPAFGFWEPEFWQLELMTGFKRNQLQARRVPHFHFDVPDAMTNWKEIEPHLLEESTWPLQLAVNIKEFGLIESINNNQNEIAKLIAKYQIENIPEIALYAASDERILNFIRFKFKYADTNVKNQIFDVFEYFLKGRPDNYEGVFQDLLLALNDKEHPSASAAKSLRLSIDNLNNKERTELFKALRQALKSNDIYYKEEAANTLIALSPALDAGLLSQLIDDLLKVLNDPDKSNSTIAFNILGNIEKYPDNTQFKSVVDILLKNLKASKSILNNGELISTLIGLMKIPDENFIQTVSAYLHLELNSPNTNAKEIAAYFLRECIENSCPIKQFLHLKSDLVLDLKKNLSDSNPKIREYSIQTINSLNEQQLAEISTIMTHDLLISIKDKNEYLRENGAETLGKIAKHLDAKTVEQTISILIKNNLVYQDTYASEKSAFAIGKLANTLNEKQTQALLISLTPLKIHKKEYAQIFAANTAGNLSKILDSKELLTIIDELITLAHQRRAGIKYYITDLSDFVKNLDSKQAQDLYDYLKKELKNSDLLYRKQLLESLLYLTPVLNTSQIHSLATDLLQKQSDRNDRYNRYNYGDLLSALSNYMNSEQARLIIPDLQRALKDQDKKKKALFALRDLTKFIDADQANAMIDDLTTILMDDKQFDTFLQTEAAILLGELAQFLNVERAKALVRNIMNFLDKGQYQDTGYYLVPLLKLALITKDRDIVGQALKFTLILGYIMPYREEYDPELFSVKSALAHADWGISNDALVDWLSDNDSNKRTFSAVILAYRTLDESTLARIKALRDDRQDRPWVKMAALRCLMEIEWKKQAAVYEQQEKAKKSAEAKAAGHS